MIESGNLFAAIPADLPAEQLTLLLTTPNVRIERIVSHGQQSPPDFWYDDSHSEWVIVLQGSAGILFEGEAAPRTLRRGDYVHIPPHARHRVAWTDKNEPTIWLAIHHS